MSALESSTRQHEARRAALLHRLRGLVGGPSNRSPQPQGRLAPNSGSKNIARTRKPWLECQAGNPI
jgi:hypothetical protein